jgi:hypothetical protein
VADNTLGRLSFYPGSTILPAGTSGSVELLAVASAAHRAQMQARPRNFSGTRASKVCVKLADMHQQGGCPTPVRRSTSIAHKFVSPQIGQCVGSDAKDGIRVFSALRLGQPA